MKSDAGNATLAALLLLLVSSALALGAATVARQGSILLGTFRSATNAVESLATTADEVQQVLESLEPDAPDSLVAPFWEEIADLAREADCAITLTDPLQPLPPQLFTEEYNQPDRHPGLPDAGC